MDDISLLLKTYRIAAAERKGVSHCSVKQISDQTVRNYKFLSAVNGNKKILRKTHKKQRIVT